MIIFDSSNPTGDDCDLGTPSFNCPTNTTDDSDDCTGTYPGTSNDGSGQNNCEALGKIVIISENYPYAVVGAPDPEPDDLGGGGTIILSFDTPYTVSEIGLVDDASGNFVISYAPGSTGPGTIPFNGGGDNDISTFSLGLTDVVEVRIELVGSGGFSHFTLCDQNTATVGDQLYIDIDGDGNYNPNIDSPIANVTVNLTLPNGSIISTETDEFGNYLFDNLSTGDYSVNVDTNDSDFPAGLENSVIPNGGTLNSNSFSLSNGENNLDQDFGYQGTASLGDQLFVDEDGDNVYTLGVDTPIPNVTVSLTNSNGDEITTTTNVNGEYIFENLLPDTYIVDVDINDTDFPKSIIPSVDADGIITPNETTVTITAGSNTDSIDFGYIPLGTIGDQLFVDEDGDGLYDPNVDTPIANVTFILTNPDGSTTTAVTDDAGNYLFENLPAGDYAIEVDTDDLDFPEDVYNTVDPQGDNNSYSALTLGVGEDNLDQDFGYEPLGTIGDQLFVDEDGDGLYNPNFDTPITNVTVILTNPDGSTTTAVTDDTGNYLFENLPAGDYTIEVDTDDLDFPEDVSNTVDSQGDNNSYSALTLGVGEDNLDQDFGYEPLGTIGDQLFVDEDGDGLYNPNFDTPIANVTVTLTNPDGSTTTAVTDDTGNYLFENLPAGDYAIEVDTDDLDFPEDIYNTVDPQGDNNSYSALTLGVGEDNLDQDFGYIPLGTIGDQLFVDEDGDGLYDPNFDTPITNVTVTLTNPDGSTTTAVTDDTGNYLFENLPAGDYKITIDTNDPDFPANVNNTIDPEGDNNSTSNVSIGIGDDNMDQDFGYLNKSSLPVDYLFISAEEENGGAIVKWATTNEINTDKFEVLSSRNGIHFVKIGEVNASINSTSTKHYSFTDDNASGTVYYRLNQVDLDSKSELSLIVTVRLENDLEVNIYPNPTVDFINIQMNKTQINSTISLINIGSGIVVKSINSTQPLESIDMTALQQGHYLLVISNIENDARIIKKISKI